MARSRKQVLKDIEQLKARRAELEKELHEATGRVFVKCEDNNYGKGCGRKSRLRNLTYIATHWYTEPYGCTGGDYWSEGEGQFDCPHCGHRNRLYNRKEVQALKHHFKAVVDSHSTRWRHPVDSKFNYTPPKPSPEKPSEWDAMMGRA